MRYKWLLVPLFIIAAEANANIPIKCPSVESIRQEKLERFVDFYDGDWYLSATSYFDTEQRWEFVAIPDGDISAVDEQDAHWKAQVLLNQVITLRDGPLLIPGQEGKAWGCLYEGYKRIIATITPPHSQQQFMKRK